MHITHSLVASSPQTTVFILLLARTQQLCHIESLHLLRRPMTAALLRSTVKDTPCNNIM